MFLEKLKLFISKLLIQSILGLGSWSMVQNVFKQNYLSISGEKNNSWYKKKKIIVQAYTKRVQNVICSHILQNTLAIAASHI